MIKGVIFDMDGVIFDTEKLYEKYWKQVMKSFNHTITNEQLSKLRGTNHFTGKIIFEEMYSDLDFENTSHEVKKLKEEYISKNGLPIKEGIENFFKQIKEKGLKLGLASSTRYETVKRYLTETNLIHYFDYIIGGNMIEKGKPEPDIYVKACEELFIKPEEAVVFEDSKNGILAGSKAGCKVVMVIDIEEHYDGIDNLIKGKIRNFKEGSNYIN